MKWMRLHYQVKNDTKRYFLTATVIVILSSLFAIGTLPHTYVSGSTSTLIQENNSGCDCSSLTVSLPSTVQPGTMILVGLSVSSGTINSITDTMNNQYFTAISESEWADIYYAVATTSSTDSVTVNLGNQAWMDMYVLDVSGVTNVGMSTASGFCGFDCTGYATTSSDSFSSGAFLFAIAQMESPPSVSPGAGFTMLNENGGVGVAYAEYAASTVSSPTAFPMNDTSGFVPSWIEVGVALNPGAPVLTTTETSTITSTSSATVTNNVTATSTVSTTKTDTISTTDVSTTTATNIVTSTATSSTFTAPPLTVTNTVTVSQDDAPVSILVYDYSSGGSPISSDLVTLTNSSGYTRTLSTNSTGQVVFTGLEAGSSYEVASNVNGVKLSAPVSTSQSGGSSIVVLEPNPTNNSLPYYYAVVVVAIVAAAFCLFQVRRRK